MLASMTFKLHTQLNWTKISDEFAFDLAATFVTYLKEIKVKSVLSAIIH